MNLRQLQYFQTLARTQHYTQTAEQFSISQPSLSHAINELEKELGIKLFQKKGRNVELTKLGQQYLAYVDNALLELNNGERFIKELTSMSHGHIELAFIYSLSAYFLPKIINAFISNPLHRNITFSFYESSTLGIIEDLKKGKYDMALCSRVENEPDIDFEQLTSQELVFVMSKNHPLAYNNVLDVKQVADYPLILFNEKSGIKPFIDKLLSEAGITPKVACYVEAENAMIGLASIDYGIGIMPRIPIPQEYNLQVIPLKHQARQRYIYIATMKERPLLPAAQRFYQSLLDYRFFNLLISS
ncbi:LysR family transcriptional regulator [Zophobihabitans entericus]|uniref:LysR family transcriptional regulator n=1 Tax=Zophobihabitans entericus TaxID=1635327 RepID=A0A6G9I8P3_9GAMM|nr:LysR family transcriptional regulator [Zophobihabitans entericus]QIQ20227.1 LysR family transcriptional regulator [Zophobihabitans entericus]